MAQEPDKWQLRQAEALASEEGISHEEAVRRVLGTVPRRKVTPVKAETPAAT